MRRTPAPHGTHTNGHAFCFMYGPAHAAGSRVAGRLALRCALHTPCSVPVSRLYMSSATWPETRGSAVTRQSVRVKQSRVHAKSCVRASPEGTHAIVRRTTGCACTKQALPRVAPACQQSHTSFQPVQPPSPDKSLSSVHCSGMAICPKRYQSSKGRRACCMPPTWRDHPHSLQEDGLDAKI